MDIPRRLIELQRAVEAAANRYRNNAGENATVALAVWSDATAPLVQGITAYAAEQGVRAARWNPPWSERCGHRSPWTPNADRPLHSTRPRYPSARPRPPSRTDAARVIRREPPGSP